ncbi:uncharacterized protein LOC113170836 [Anabas testudineus]|uniref:uncharacterized protein LOC113170836 n=1 Tax=Anabas testudineus TaxID=64144 RepID=UPI000E45F721|nr:uncharacterized protein LOC113170836 [Anabas testudineus]
MDRYINPHLSKGRGLLLSDIIENRDVGHSKSVPDGNKDSGLSHSPTCTPVRGFRRGSVYTSTPDSDADAIHHLTDMVGQLGAQIGESIVAKLLSAGVMNTSGDNLTTPTAQTTYRDTVRQDLPHVTVHVKSDRELPTFRGENTDKYSVQDWIDMTKSHLRKHEIPVDGQAEEIMSHLLGKARDVVRIALRSDSGLDVKKSPEIVYDVLLHYFSDAPSCLPLADFYATLPRHKENPVDYWIRLNKAADLAMEGLQRQGKRTENMADEVALMFVKHCPDPDLSYTLKCKPINEWTSRDVQLRIDDYQRELRASGRVTGAAQLKNHTTTITTDQPSLSPVDPTVPTHCYACTPAQVQRPACRQDHLTPASCPVPAEPDHTVRCTSIPAMAQNLQQTEEKLLTRMVDIFQGMMDKMQQRGSHSTRARRFPSSRRERRPNETVCKVCDDAGHSTISHCMSDRLCFTCLAPGHTRQTCPGINSSQPQSSEN